MMPEEIHLGQKIVKYKCPIDIVKKINEIYDRSFDSLIDNNNNLAGKIKEEKSLYFDKKNKQHNVLTKDIISFFETCFTDYAFRVQHLFNKRKISSIWVNEMKKNEYNPMHTHTSSDSFYGLSSVLFLKVPNDYGVEYARSDNPNNGRLEFMANSGGQFSINQFKVHGQEGEFYVFPFDLLHGVYPFNSDVKRRTLSANCNIYKEKELINGS
jgi:hypothetical protein|tara:strand:- start:257 stop:892 length:636 start_codon:yes stop_codon:yes gene_type:complete